MTKPWTDTARLNRNHKFLLSPSAKYNNIINRGINGYPTVVNTLSFSRAGLNDTARQSCTITRGLMAVHPALVKQLPLIVI